MGGVEGVGVEMELINYIIKMYKILKSRVKKGRFIRRHLLTHVLQKTVLGRKCQTHTGNVTHFAL